MGTTPEDQKKALIEARAIARKTDRNVIIARSISDPYERERLLPETIKRREIAFARLRELEELHRQNGWWLPKDTIEISEISAEDLHRVIDGFVKECAELANGSFKNEGCPLMDEEKTGL
jgi:hypothetical protein